MRVWPLLLVAFALPGAVQGQEHTGHVGHEPPADSAFAALQARGALVMGVDQYTSRHRFEDAPDGGRILFERLTNDSAGALTIRAHLRAIAEQFAAGDFGDPAVVHATTVPGTETMQRLRDRIRYEVRSTARGGALLIASDDAEAVAAIHRFLAFQRRAHRTSPNPVPVR